MNVVILVLTFFTLCIVSVHCFIEGLYCGRDNCYEVLGLDRDSSKSEIVKSYRQLALKYHPDRHKTKEAKDEATKKFTLIATAYEILKDEDSRRDYDYMLDNPDEIYSHYFSYYRRRMTPKVDVRIVIAVTITVISVVQYWGAWNRYQAAINYFVTVPKYRMRAQEIAKEVGLLGTNVKRKGKRSKEAVREEEEQIYKKIIEEKMDMRGAICRPSMKDVLWLQLILLPYTIWSYTYFYGRWLWKFTLRGHPLGQEEKEYVIRRWLKMSHHQWLGLFDSERDELLERQCWIWENFKTWKEEKDAERKAKLAESSRHKMYRRYMKNHGPGQITFDD